jgi:hypothetical protein
MADTTRGARGMSAGIVLWHVTMSLDGFIAGPDDAMDWVFEYAEPNPAVDEVIRTTGAILAGRRTYDVGRRDVGKPSGEAFGGAWTGPQFVLTHDVPDGSDDPSVTFLGGDITNAVNRALTVARTGLGDGWYQALDIVFVDPAAPPAEAEAPPDSTGPPVDVRKPVEAANGGARSVHLDTYDFQALGFYKKLGYGVFGELDDYPPGHTRYFLTKPLDVPS